MSNRIEIKEKEEVKFGKKQKKKKKRNNQPRI